jgi:Bacterial SH3 domain
MTISTMLLTTFAIVTGPLFLQAQDFSRAAAIDDPDGYTWIRAGASTNAEKICKVEKGETFRTHPQTAPWWRVKNQDGLVGFMHSSRIRLLDVRSFPLKSVTDWSLRRPLADKAELERIHMEIFGNGNLMFRAVIVAKRPDGRGHVATFALPDYSDGGWYMGRDDLEFYAKEKGQTLNLPDLFVPQPRTVSLKSDVAVPFQIGKAVQLFVNRSGEIVLVAAQYHATSVTEIRDGIYEVGATDDRYDEEEMSASMRRLLQPAPKGLTFQIADSAKGGAPGATQGFEKPGLNFVSTALSDMVVFKDSRLYVFGYEKDSGADADYSWLKSLPKSEKF